jgi:hypothetical protein
VGNTGLWPGDQMSVVAGILTQASTVPNSGAFSRACPLGPAIKSPRAKYQAAEPQLLCQRVEYNVFYLTRNSRAAS